MTYIFKCSCCNKVEKNVTEANNENDVKILYIESYDCETCRSKVQSSIYEYEHA